MKIVHVGRLQRAAAARKAGYLEAHRKVGRTVTVFGQAFVQLSDGDYAAIRKEFALAPALVLTQATAVSDGGVARKPKPGIGVKQIPRTVKLPSLGAMAKNAVGAAGRVITAAAGVQAVRATEEEFQRRMKICTACEFLDKANQRCSKCGCFVSAQVIGKARLATEKCPENKWLRD